MKLTVYLFVFTLLFASVFATIFDSDSEEGEEEEYALGLEQKLNLFDVLEYFEEQNSPMQRDFEMNEMIKRKGSKSKKKVGPCKMPNGIRCQLCNLKVRNRQDMRRYVLCGGGIGA